MLEEGNNEGCSCGFCSILSLKVDIFLVHKLERNEYLCACAKLSFFLVISTYIICRLNHKGYVGIVTLGFGSSSIYSKRKSSEAYNSHKRTICENDSYSTCCNDYLRKPS
ncbi:hypothetical protein RIF29_29171 [Crotalaria pallida]|uniref:Uncharacterized protein n=1 Tax=Crotalaria pallida TaxID=3830 RepID=A0AAN9EE16_CROPI